MSQRLTNDLKDQIVQNSLDKAGITAARAAHAVKRNEWVEEARAQVNGISDAEIKKIEAGIEKLRLKVPKPIRDYPGNVANRDAYLRLNLAGASVHEYFFTSDGKKDYRYCPNARTALLADDPLVQRFYDLEAEKAALDERQKTVAAHVRGAIDKVTTVKRLLLAWPEAAELLPPTTETLKSTLPTLVVEDLNALIGLPTDEAAA